MPPSYAFLGEFAIHDNVTRTQNVSEYMFVLALCLVVDLLCNKLSDFEKCRGLVVQLSIIVVICCALCCQLVVQRIHN